MSEHTDDPFPVGCRVRYTGPSHRGRTGTVDDRDRMPICGIPVTWDDDDPHPQSVEQSPHLTRIDSEPDPADPDAWPLAESWEDCARHVEAGGVVEVRVHGRWERDDVNHRQNTGHISDLYYPRRLAPIAGPAPESSTDPGEGEADEFTEARRRVHHLIDEYGLAGVTSLVQEHPDAAQLATIPAIPTVPDGHEIVVLPMKYVDTVAGYAVDGRDMAGPSDQAIFSCREAVARRPKPAPETERVPWWEAVGRGVLDQDGERVTIEHVSCGDGAGPSVAAYNAAKRAEGRLLRVPCPVHGDGTVEVLVEDGES